MDNILDLPQTTLDSQKIINQKKFFKKVYQYFYRIFQKYSVNLAKGPKIELGSGAGFIKELIPDVITSDVIKLPICDRVINAEKIPYRDSTLSVIYLLNTFHHIKNPKKALLEFDRTLKKGGKVIMIEPYNSRWGRFIYKNFHYEGFDETISQWKIKGKGPLSDANNALPSVIFERDRDQYKKLFPHLELSVFTPHTPFLYLLSGGLKKNQFVPTGTFNWFKTFEKFLSPLNKQLGMFVTIVLTKN
jgi:SAM-dependent methyltransferase